MTETAQNEEPTVSLTERALNLLKETKLLQINKSANMLVDLFSKDKQFTRIKPRRIGQQIEMKFPALNGSLTFTLVSKREDFNCIEGEPENPVARVTFNVKEDKVLKEISDIISMKDSVLSLAKVLPKLLLRKLKIKGSLFAAIVLFRCLTIGKHEVYKGQL